MTTGKDHATATLRVGRWRAQKVVLAAAAAVFVAVGAALASGLLLVTATPHGAPRVGAEVPVTATDQITRTSNNSPAIMADPTNGRFLALANRIDARDFSCALSVSGDGGATWLPTSPVAKLPEGVEKCYAPEIAFDRDGVFYYLFVGLGGKGNVPTGAFLTTSTDRGRRFSTPRRVLDRLSFGVRMAIDPSTGSAGRIHLVWIKSGGEPALGGFAAADNPIMTAHSDDKGRSFSEPVRVSDPKRTRVVGPALAIGPDRHVHIAYFDLQDDARDYLGLEGPTWADPWSLVVATSTDGGQTFSNGSVVDEVTLFERPILIFTTPPPALVATGTRLCAAWADGRNGDADVFLRCTPDGGQSWEPVVRLNDDPVGTGVRQYLPRLAVAPGGRIDATFLDRRHHPTQNFNDVTYTYSTDGGRHFAPDRRITTEGSPVNVGARYANASAKGQYEFGGRLGLLSRRSSALAAWPDTRYSVPGTGQDVLSAPIRFPTRHQPAWARLLGAVLILAGLRTGGAALARRPQPLRATDP